MRPLVNYEVIKKASHGDVNSINYIVEYYMPYIKTLSTIQYINEFDQLAYGVDEEAVGRLKTKLITKIISFNPTPRHTLS